MACQWCGHHVYPCVGTPFERSRIDLHAWFYAIYAFGFIYGEEHGRPNPTILKLYLDVEPQFARRLLRPDKIKPAYLAELLGVTEKQATRMVAVLRPEMEDGGLRMLIPAGAAEPATAIRLVGASRQSVIMPLIAKCDYCGKPAKPKRRGINTITCQECSGEAEAERERQRRRKEFPDVEEPPPRLTVSICVTCRSRVWVPERSDEHLPHRALRCSACPAG